MSEKLLDEKSIGGMAEVRGSCPAPEPHENSGAVRSKGRAEKNAEYMTEVRGSCPAPEPHENSGTIRSKGRSIPSSD